MHYANCCHTNDDEVSHVRTVLTAAMNAANCAPRGMADIPMHLKQLERLRDKIPHTNPLRGDIDAVYDGLKGGRSVDVNGMGVFC